MWLGRLQRVLLTNLTSSSFAGSEYSSDGGSSVPPHVTEQSLQEEDAEVNALLKSLSEGVPLIQESQIQKISLLQFATDSMIHHVKLGDRPYVLKEGVVRSLGLLYSYPVLDRSI